MTDDHMIIDLVDGLTVVSGPNPPPGQGLRSDRIQVLHWRIEQPFADPGPHRHTDSDEIYLVLSGAIDLEIDGRTVRVAADQACAVPAGVTHSLTAVHYPARGLSLRGPAIADKITA